MLPLCHHGPLKYSVVINKKVSKRLKPQKPYWDNKLTCLWKLLREQEKLFTHNKGSSGQMKKKLRCNYKAAENKFDKLLRQKKRKYNRDRILAFDELSDNNPKAFWDKLKNLGPKQRKQIPLRVKINETYDSDLNTIKIGGKQITNHYTMVKLMKIVTSTEIVLIL